MLSITAFEPLSNRVNGTLIDHSGVEVKLAGGYIKLKHKARAPHIPVPVLLDVFYNIQVASLLGFTPLSVR